MTVRNARVSSARSDLQPDLHFLARSPPLTPCQSSIAARISRWATQKEERLPRRSFSATNVHRATGGAREGPSRICLFPIRTHAIQRTGGVRGEWEGPSDSQEGAHSPRSYLGPFPAALYAAAAVAAAFSNV